MTTRFKRPDPDDLKALLLEGPFNTATEDPGRLAPSEPVTPVQLVLTLAQIKAYDHNPRRERNPAYDAIKASVHEQRGLNNPFTVTRRPGETLFMVQAGGNTRLAILKELFAETGDAAFNSVQCLYRPWQSETSLLTAHLIENELRGEMTLIDKAYALRELHQQLETEHEMKLTRTAFCQRLKAMGYSLSRRQLIRFDYAMTLDQLIPHTLRNGLGATGIDQIKATEKAYQRLCQDKTPQFAALFAHTLASCDDEPWDLEVVRRELDKQLAPLLDIPVTRLRQTIDASLFNAPDDEDWPDDPGQPTATDHQASTTLDQSSAHASPTDPCPASTDVDTVTPRYPAEPDTPADIHALYERTYGLAHRIARSIHLEQVVVPVSQGLGFIIEKPQAAFTAHATWGLWWLLLGIAEQSVSPERDPLWQHTDLYQLQQDPEGTALQQLVGPAPSVSHYPHEVLQNKAIVPDPVFTDICQLIETCRHIRQHYPSTQLWPSGPP
ncbi:hypothetical protein GO003_021275 [Methylicorpusculum oleiharenae]|uniref:ParB family protein n=1 Tax=Methylicorpusculum oleiharenae TaxID=1338687 RepID=UPI001357DFEA|nr:ParB family protein [Methylicorpusculum oleiharenae]MCD2452917.1 hypothetical protein [Methylicorpusculum oleiharenae]